MWTADAKIDVFIPAHAKDFPVLPLCVKSLQRYLRPRPARITVVCAESRGELERVVPDYPVNWLHESAVCDILPRDAMPQFKWDGGDRSGWYYQQLVKYALRKHSRTKHYLVMDADTVMVRQTRFIRDGRYVFYRSTQFHEPYFRTYETLLGYFPQRQSSFITDFMIFDVALVDKLLASIAANAKAANWYEAILQAIDPFELSSFSEYETYGYYMSHHYPGYFESVPVVSTMLPRTRLKWLWIDSIVARLKGAFTISYHHHLS